MTKRIEVEEPVETLAFFGSGALVRTKAGRYEFRGGTRSERLEVQEWISLFAHDIVLNAN
jgi:hypothetical protein